MKRLVACHRVEIVVEVVITNGDQRQGLSLSPLPKAACLPYSDTQQQDGNIYLFGASENGKELHWQVSNTYPLNPYSWLNLTFSVHFRHPVNFRVAKVET